MCGSVTVRRKNQKNVWWNDVVIAAVERKEAAWQEVLGDRNNRCMEVHKKEKRKVKRCIYKGKKEVNEQFGSDESGCRWE